MEGVQWAIKPFSKQFTPALGVVGASHNAVFDLLDTDGNPIDCNYVEIVAKDTPVAVGWVFVQPVLGYAQTFSNTSIFQNTGVSVVGGTLDPTKPGFGGVARNLDSNLREEPIIIRTSGGEMFNQIRINNVAAVTCDFQITYGVIYPVNSLETLKTPTRGQ